MNELFSLPNNKKSKPNEYQKAYAMIYTFTDNKKLQDKLFEYLEFRKNNCVCKGYRFYSSCIKSFLDSINTQMKGATDDEIWEAVNLTLSYPSMHLLVPYKNNSGGYQENFTSPKSSEYTPALDENGNPIVF